MQERSSSARERKGEGADAVVASVRVLEAVLDVDGSDDAFAVLFQSLRPFFAFDQIAVLDIGRQATQCVAARPPALVGRSWRGDFLPEVLRGRVLMSGHDGAGAATSQALPPDLLSPGQPALAFPISVQDRHFAVLMTRADGRDAFSREQIAVARCAAVVALAGSAVRSGDDLDAEIQRLNVLVERLRESERSAQQDYNLLRAIIELLPSRLVVRDDQDRPVLVNALATTGTAVDEEAARRLREVTASQGDRVSVTEECVADETGVRTWLTLHKPVRIQDQTFLLSTSTDITERKQLENEWTRRVYFDDLTGLPNRLFIQKQVESLAQRMGDGGRFALAFIDLDNFKHVNDYYSFEVGDALLAKVAVRISGSLRETDVLARIGGDEFLLLLDPIDNVYQVQAMIDRILVDMKQPFHVDTFEIFTSASIGVSFYPEHGQGYEALRRNADNATHRVKSGTKGAALFFDSEMAQSIMARMEHEQQLRLAIRDNRFCCAFQPKVDIYSQQVVGFESLVRWRDENGENRSPGTFISLAIELGLIDTITHFVLAETLSSIERLDESFGAGTTVSINVPSKLTSDLTFMHQFIEALKSSGYADRLMLELTEDAFVATNPFQTQVLPMLRDIGVGISIDDFGTGYSSLAALADVTADELKVDRSFITDIHQRPRSQSILKSIESLGLALGMSMVAEGVESIEELAYLQEATHIRCAQGFYFSKPFFLDDAPGARGVKATGRGAEPPRERAEISSRIRAARGRAY